METQDQSQSGGYQLNVVFHGLWAYVVGEEGIDAYTVQDPDHVFLAGNWLDEQPIPAGDYELLGVEEGSASVFSDQENPVVRAKINMDDSATHCSISLPLPREIHSKRKFPTAGLAVFEGADAAGINPAEIAMVHVLVYDFEDPGSLEIDRLDWQPVMNPDERTVNLHLFAQEPSKVAADHYIHAYRKLAGSFGLDISPISTSNVPVDNPTGIDGLPPEQEGDLIERDLSAQGVSGGNCENLVIYPDLEAA